MKATQIFEKVFREQFTEPNKYIDSLLTGKPEGFRDYIEEALHYLFEIGKSPDQVIDNVERVQDMLEEAIWYAEDHPEKWEAIESSLNQQTSAEMVSHPSHYNMGPIEAIDCIDVAVNNALDLLDHYRYLYNIVYPLGTAIKYLARVGSKKSDSADTKNLVDKIIQDLKKTKWYLNRVIQIASKKG